MELADFHNTGLKSMPLLEITVYGPLACVRTPNLKEKEKICIKNCFVVTFNLM